MRFWHRKLNFASIRKAAHISAVIITKNEAAHIGRCLESLQGLADEMIVADSHSEDRTVEIAKSYGARVISIEWKGYSATKNEANSIAKHDWILSLDADEFLSDELKFNIAQTDLSIDNICYEFRRTNYIGSYKIRFGSFNPDYKIRLWNRNRGNWEGTLHEQLQLDCDVTIQRISGSLEHYSYSDHKDHRKRAEKYAAMAAENMHRQGGKASFFKPVLSAVFKFLNDYFFRFGVLDGSAGLHIALTGSRAAFLKYYLLRKLNKGAHEATDVFL